MFSSLFGGDEEEQAGGRQAGTSSSAGLDLWGMANSLGSTFKASTEELLKSVQQTDWQAELRAFSKEAAEDAKALGHLAEEELHHHQQQLLAQQAQPRSHPQSGSSSQQQAHHQQHLEHVGEQLRTFGQSLLIGTREIIDQVRDAVESEIAVAARESKRAGRAGRNRLGATSASYPTGASKYNRFEAEVAAMQHDSSTYLDEPTDVLEYQQWLSGFNMEQAQPNIDKALKDNAFLAELQSRIVPSIVEPSDFWRRYFYHLHKLEVKEQARQKLAQRALASSAEDDAGTGWDVGNEGKDDELWGDWGASPSKGSVEEPQPSTQQQQPEQEQQQRDAQDRQQLLLQRRQSRRLRQAAAATEKERAAGPGQEQQPHEGGQQESGVWAEHQSSPQEQQEQARKGQAEEEQTHHQGEREQEHGIQEQGQQEQRGREQQDQEQVCGAASQTSASAGQHEAPLTGSPRKHLGLSKPPAAPPTATSSVAAAAVKAVSVPTAAGSKMVDQEQGDQLAAGTSQEEGSGGSEIKDKLSNSSSDSSRGEWCVLVPETMKQDAQACGEEGEGVGAQGAVGASGTEVGGSSKGKVQNVRGATLKGGQGVCKGGVAQREVSQGAPSVDPGRSHGGPAADPGAGLAEGKTEEDCWADGASTAVLGVDADCPDDAWQVEVGLEEEGLGVGEEQKVGSATESSIMQRPLPAAKSEEEDEAWGDWD